MYEIIIPNSTHSTLKKIPEDIRNKCIVIFQTLQYSFAPRGYDVKKLKGYSMAFRIRVGDWRVTYEVLKGEKKIIIHDVRLRKKGYKR